MNKKRKTLLIFAALLILIPTLFMVIRCQRRNFQEEEAETVRTVKYAAPKDQGATASYLVEHYLQNIQKNGYEKNDSETLYGQPGALTQATAWVFPGFTTKAFQQKAIREDNSTVIAIYYDRQEIRYTIDLAGGSLPGEKQRFTITGTYGKKVALPLPQKKGYLFSSGTPELPATFGEGDYPDFRAADAAEFRDKLFFKGFDLFLQNDGLFVIAQPAGAVL